MPTRRDITILANLMRRSFFEADNGNNLDVNDQGAVQDSFRLDVSTDLYTASDIHMMSRYCSLKHHCLFLDLSLINCQFRRDAGSKQ